MAYIGDVYVPVITELSADKRKKENIVLKPINSEPIVVPLRKDVRQLKMEGILIPEGAKTEDNFAEDLMAVAERHPAYNHLNYAGFDGFVVVDDIDIPKTAEVANMREFTITGKFLPRTVYERAYKLRNEIIVNDFGIGFPPVIALPVGAYNVKLKSPWDIIHLNQPWAKIQGKDGEIPFYKPFPLFDQDNYVNLTGDVLYLEKAYRLQTINLDSQGEYVEWNIVVGSEIPKGTYKLILRIRDDNVADDIKVTITGSVSGTILEEILSTNSTDFVVLETSEFSALTNETLTIRLEKATTNTNVIEIDYCYLEPTYTAKLAFDVDSEVNVGEVRVWDTMGETDESKWVRVFNKEHKFVGDCVIENGLWKIRIPIGYAVKASTWTGAGYTNEYTIFHDNSTVSEFKVLKLTNDNVRVRVGYLDGHVYDVVFGRLSLVGQRFGSGEINVYRFVIDDLGNATINLEKIVDGISTTLASASVTATTGTWYNIKVEWDTSTGVINVYFDGATTPTISAIDTTFTSGYVGLVATVSATGVGYLDVEFDNLSITATEVVGRGAQVNRFIDDFDWDSSAEYTVLTGTGFSWDTINGTLKAYSDTEPEEILQLNSLKFGSGTYKVRMKINSTVTTIDRAIDLLFGMQDVNNWYAAHLVMYSTGVQRLELIKRANGIQTAVAYANVTITEGKWYEVKVEWDASSGSISLYLDGTLVLTVTDATFTSGYVGFRAKVSGAGTGYLDVEWDDLEVNAEEVTSSGNTCVILSGVNHGGRYDVNETAAIRWTAGVDIPLGRYLLAVRAKTTDTTTVSANMTTKNDTDATTIRIDTTLGYFGIESELSESYVYVIKPIELGSDDNGDTIRVSVWESGIKSNDATAVIYDYILLIPISLLESQQLGPQDIAFMSMADPNLKRVLEVKS